MVRKILYRRLREGQTTVLQLASQGPVARASLDSNGLKVALFSLKRYGLINEQGQITPTGRTALAEGKYPIEADPLENIFLGNVRTLMETWKVKRLEAIYRAVALAAKDVKDKQKGEL